MIAPLVIVHLYNRSWNPVNLAPPLNDSELSLRETSLFHTESCCETCYHLTLLPEAWRVQLSAHPCIQLWFQMCVQQEFKQILAKTQICLISCSLGCTLTQFLILSVYKFLVCSGADHTSPSLFLVCCIPAGPHWLSRDTLTCEFVLYDRRLSGTRLRWKDSRTNPATLSNFWREE